MKEKILKSFDEQFGKTIRDKEGYPTSEGKAAGCDNCPTNCEERDKHRIFLSSAIDTAYEAGRQAPFDEFNRK